jgi:histidyl-tRNA synthetase
MIESVKGTRDILPAEAGRWQFVESHARDCFSRFGFNEIRTPILEHTDLFRRSIGEDTDIVAKEMYTFTDRKGRSLTLRPENTAPVVRAYIEHALHRRSEIERLYYIGPMFRYERPQKGRMRQFHQIGAEVLGSDHPAIDADTLSMLMTFLEGLGIGPLQLAINSVGCLACRADYRRVLVDFLTPQKDRLCPDCRRRLDTNPLRCLDCKVPADRRLLEQASPILDSLCAACREHFDGVRAHLAQLAVAYTIDARMVRGLDYYCRTAFEVTQPTLGAQNAILGGGRYDGLVEALGGPAIPGFGFAVGEDRLVMSLPDTAELPDTAPEIVMVTLGEAALPRALSAARTLRASRRSVVLDPLPGKSLKAQMRRANDLRARFVLILGETEMNRRTFTVKRMSDGVQATVGEGEVEATIREMTHA